MTDGLHIADAIQQLNCKTSLGKNKEACPKQFVVTNLTFLRKSIHIQMYILYIDTFTNVHMYKIYLQNPVSLPFAWSGVHKIAHYVSTSSADFVHKVHSQNKININNLNHFLKLLQKHFCFLQLHTLRILTLQSWLKTQKGGSFCQAKWPPAASRSFRSVTVVWTCTKSLFCRFCSVTSGLPLASVPPRPADKQHMSSKIPLLKETRAALPTSP